MTFKPLITAAAVTAALLGTGVGSWAEETTTTTTRTTTERPVDPGVTVGVPGVVGVHIGGDTSVREGCTTRKTTHTNEETGDSVTHKSTDCD